MNSVIAFAILIVLAAVNHPTTAWGADTASDARLVKVQAASLPDLRQAAASAGSYQSSSIKVKSTAHQVTIDVIDSKLNNASAADRTAEASAIASAVAKSIGGKPEFAAVVTLHVDYLKGSGTTARLVQGFVFNKGSDGSFKPHQS